MTEASSPQAAPLEIHPLSGALGAEIRGADLTGALDPSLIEKIREALLSYGVVVFRDQGLDHDHHIAFARSLGEPDVHPIAEGLEDHPEMLQVYKPAGQTAFFGTSWHTDNTFFERPSAITVLHGVTIPPYGGDTLFASSERAWDHLSEPIKRFLEPLTAVHSARPAFDPKVTGDAKYQGDAPIKYRMSDAVYAEVVHPVIRTHPETGRKSIFVNPMFTTRINELEAHESEAVLQMLYAHTTRPEFTCRVRWAPKSLVVWDNRQTQHYAVDDYSNHERLMFRVTIRGDRPQ